MIFEINTRKRKNISVDFLIFANSRRLNLIAYDTNRPKIVYTDRNMFVNGNENYQVRLPYSPDKLTVILTDIDEDKKNKNIFFVTQIDINKLKTKPLIIDDITKEFIDFATVFVNNKNYLQAGIYKSKNKNFEIKYLNKIIGDDGNELNTSLRIHKIKNYIEVSRSKANAMSVASLMYLLLHEFSHNFLNKNNYSEKEADTNAMYVYLALGYSKIESVFSLTAIFHDTDAHLERLANMKKLLNDG